MTEMVTGRVQVGDSQFEQRWTAAHINVAGDQDDENAPTYETMRILMPYLPFPVNGPVIQRINRNVEAENELSLESYGVRVATIDEVTNHLIADVFWNFMNSTALVYSDGNYTTDLLFPNPYYATGRPIVEPYWAMVKVGGSPKDVLIQCFERRCLTYTPGNSDGWQVEAGNVGRHYFEWRYEPELKGKIALQYVDGYEIMYANGTELSRVILPGSTPPAPGDYRNITDPSYANPQWSPDGSRITLEYWFETEPGVQFPEIDIFVTDVDGTNYRRLTHFADQGGQAHSPTWSPDGEWIAFRAPYQESSTVYLIRPDGSEQHRVDIPLDGWHGQPAWSPNSKQIAFANGRLESGELTVGIWIIDSEGGQPRHVIDCEGYCSDLDWSPDGLTLLFGDDGSSIYSVEISTGNRQVLVNQNDQGQHGGVSPTWSPDGKFIGYIGVGGNAIQNVWVMEADGSHKHPVSFDGGISIDWSHDSAS